MASVSKFRMNSLSWLLLPLALGLGYSAGAGSVPDVPPTTVAGGGRADQRPPSLVLGPGDTVSVKVFGQPDMDGTVYIADDGTIRLPLVGSVAVLGLSPTQVGLKIEEALKAGAFLVNPHVDVTLVHSVSQLVSVLGEDNKPG